MGRLEWFFDNLLMTILTSGSQFCSIDILHRKEVGESLCWRSILFVPHSTMSESLIDMFVHIFSIYEPIPIHSRALPISQVAQFILSSVLPDTLPSKRIVRHI
jgi:hypothetical protein